MSIRTPLLLVLSFATGCQETPLTQIPPIEGPDPVRDVALRAVLVERLPRVEATDEFYDVPAQGFGTGVLLGRNQILTAAHVVLDAKAIRVRVPSRGGLAWEIARAKTVVMDKGTDLALLEVDLAGASEPVPIALSDLVGGDHPRRPRVGHQSVPRSGKREAMTP